MQSKYPISNSGKKKNYGFIAFPDFPHDNTENIQFSTTTKN